MQWRAISEVRRLAAKALENGATLVSPTRVEWDLGAYCEDPKSRDVIGRGYLKGVYQAQAVPQVNPGTLIVSLAGLPCRQCVRCLQVRAAHWRDRAMIEMSRVSRTWLCTFTLKPELQHRLFMEELVAKTSRGWLDSDFEGDEEFRLRANGGLKLLTKFWKSVRKPYAGEDPVGLRYVAVAEAHQSGLPHFHALVHDEGSNLTYRRLQSRWVRNGFFSAKLADGTIKSARYVTKYIAKDNLCRVRASIGYGLPSEGIASDWLYPEGVER